MQIHEITITEAATARAPVRTGLAQRAQTRGGPAAGAAPTGAETDQEKMRRADQAEIFRREQQAAAVPDAGPLTQAIGKFIANKIGPRGLPSQTTRTPAQQQPTGAPAAANATVEPTKPGQQVSTPTQGTFTKNPYNGEWTRDSDGLLMTNPENIKYLEKRLASRATWQGTPVPLNNPVTNLEPTGRKVSRNRT